MSNLAEISHLKLLSECDLFHDTQFSVDETRAMASELPYLRKLVNMRSLPPPPEVVSLSSGEIADEPFGWDGLTDFCDSLNEILEQSLSTGIGIVSIGD